MRKTDILVSIILLVALSLLLSSCATVTVPKVSVPPQEKLVCNILGSNIIHTVSSGETLWRISKMYGVSVQDITRANSLGKSDKIENGQKLVIPNAATTKAAIPLYPSRKWEYIIIHHSATDVGDAYSLNILHKRRGWDGLGYDFVIDNGTQGKKDGAIEVSARWTKQVNGAHCHASDMNSKGIGICLIGNFSKDKVSAKQMDSLVYLVNILKKYYNIPMNKIMGHGQVPEARTECPGNFFTWREFQDKLRNCN